MDGGGFKYLSRKYESNLDHSLKNEYQEIFMKKTPPRKSTTRSKKNHFQLPSSTARLENFILTMRERRRQRLASRNVLQINPFVNEIFNQFVEAHLAYHTTHHILNLLMISIDILCISYKMYFRKSTLTQTMIYISHDGKNMVKQCKSKPNIQS